MGGWKSERMENIVVFPLMCLVGGVEKWEDRKLFCLVGEKKGKDRSEERRVGKECRP